MLIPVQLKRIHRLFSICTLFDCTSDYAKVTLSDPKKTAGILALGFKGYYTGAQPSRDEELVADLVEIEKNGIPVFTVTSVDQSAKIHVRGYGDHLSGKLRNKGNVYELEQRKTITTWFQNILIRAGLPVWEWTNTYARLWQTSLFQDRKRLNWEGKTFS